MSHETKRFTIGNGKGVAFTDPMYAEHGELPWCAWADSNCDVSGYDLAIHYNEEGDYAIIIAPSSVSDRFDVEDSASGLAITGPSVCDKHVELGMDSASMFIGFDDPLDGIPVNTGADGMFGDLYYAESGGGFGFGFVLCWVDPDYTAPSRVIDAIAYNFDAR